MNITRVRRSVVGVSAAVVLPVSLGIAAPAASADSGSQPFGPGCSSLPAEGQGSAAGMADDPVATAASNNAELSTLTAAINAADLGDTLNKSKDITVFAPTNAAFEKIPRADLDALLADKDQLTKVLTYHVVDQKITQSQLGNGDFKTLQGSNLTTSGSGDTFKVNNSANIVCGGIPTANATVELVDTVLMPQ
ncbi:fasciclin domain-containing protein [Streptomyces clavifer]|uniref:fasciclin domain-containing protein n=1 Tax=Streptomyces clavifer TaxID=68188 RepID=UPI00308D64BE|nr:fasciclin domain-containing protein [Streptomyces clavifer]